MAATRTVPGQTQFISFAVTLALLALSVTLLTGRLDANAQTATGFSTGQTVVTIDALNLRDDASTTAGIVQVLPTGAYAEILDGPIADSEYSWYLIQVDTVSGYVAGDFLADAVTAGSFANGDTVYVYTDSLNLRDSGTLSGAVIDTLDPETTDPIVSGPLAPFRGRRGPRTEDAIDLGSGLFGTLPPGSLFGPAIRRQRHGPD